MRLLNLAMAVTALSTLTPATMASMGDANIPRDITLPEECQSAVKSVEKDVGAFLDWAQHNLCRDEQQVSFAMIKGLIDPVGKRYSSLFSQRVKLPTGFKAVFFELYETVVNECILNPEGGIVDHPNLCTNDAAEKFENLREECKAEVIGKTMASSSESTRLDGFCEPFAAFIKEVFVDTKTHSEKEGTLNPYMVVNACSKQWDGGKLAELGFPTSPPLAYGKCPF